MITNPKALPSGKNGIVLDKISAWEVCENGNLRIIVEQQEIYLSGMDKEYLLRVLTAKPDETLYLIDREFYK